MLICTNNECIKYFRYFKKKGYKLFLFFLNINNMLSYFLTKKIGYIFTITVVEFLHKITHDWETFMHF